MSFKKSWFLRISLAMALTLVLVGTVAALAVPSAQAAQSSTFPTISPSQLQGHYLAPSQLHTATQMMSVKRAAGFSGGGIQFVPTFNGSFTFNNTTFPFTMVGSDPALGSHTTHIKTIVIPVAFHFPDQNVTFSGGGQNTDTLLDSPIFSKNHMLTGSRAQWSDALMRNQFNNFVTTTSPNYHVLLNQPDVRPTLHFTLPFNTSNEVADLVFKTTNNISIGIVDINVFIPWIENEVLAMHLPADSLPIFQFRDVYLNFGSIDPKNLQCCVLGFHDTFTSASNPNAIHTEIFESVSTPGIFSGVAGITAMSHETAEWLDDPLGNNPTPPWLNAGGGCQNNLETGDFLEGNPIAPILVDGFTLQDETNLWWFARTPQPTPAKFGLYDFAGRLNTFSTAC
ncbi:MAG TPA: hypothetical protein VKY19_22560 [Ktedonosporobacter sp.]|jgi:hypothetical protein|nr:hypothetical protein [Ktedonosporobacter sp.]